MKKFCNGARNFLRVTVWGWIVFLPQAVFAIEYERNEETKEFIKKAYREFGVPFFWVLFALALIWFSWNIFVCVRDSESDSGREQCKKSIAEGLVGFFIMMSVVGLVAILAKSLGVDNPIHDIFFDS